MFRAVKEPIMDCQVRNKESLGVSSSKNSMWVNPELYISYCLNGYYLISVTVLCESDTS